VNDEILDDGMLGLGRSDEELSPGAAEAILRAVKWGKIYVYGFLGLYGLQLFGSLISGAGVGLGETLLAVISLTVFSVLLFGYPVYKFINFLNSTPKGIRTYDHAAFVKGIVDLKSSMRYVAILIFVLLGAYVGILLLALLVGGISSL